MLLSLINSRAQVADNAQAPRVRIQAGVGTKKLV